MTAQPHRITERQLSPGKLPPKKKRAHFDPGERIYRVNSITNPQTAYPAQRLAVSLQTTAKMRRQPGLESRRVGSRENREVSDADLLILAEEKRLG